MFTYACFVRDPCVPGVRYEHAHLPKGRKRWPAPVKGLMHRVGRGIQYRSYDQLFVVQIITIVNPECSLNNQLNLTTITVLLVVLKIIFL